MRVGRRDVMMGLGAAVLAPAVWPAAAQAQERLTKFAPNPGGSGSVSHEEWSALLGKYVVAGPAGVDLFRYGDVTPADRATLKAYIARLGATQVTALPKDEQFVVWANLYNAVTIDVVLGAYPVRSIKAIALGGIFSGPWKKQLVTVEGEALALDDIEHGILRPLWQDARVHYAVNCASIGCPNLGSAALSAEGLDAELDRRARAYVNSSRGARLQDGAIVASRIYDWFQEDFGGNERGVLAHLSRHAEPGLADAIRSGATIRSYAYDWSLNDATT